jgi:hypothetical protein
MDMLMIFGTQLVLSIFVYALIAKWYVVPWLADKPMEQVLIALIFPHALRHVGLTFFAPGVVADSLPEAFAYAAAYGDLVSGLLAIASLIALRNSWVVALPLVWVFNVVGSLDLLNALRQAEAVPYLEATWYIPTFFVPLLLVTHVMIFTRLPGVSRQQIKLATAE